MNKFMMVDFGISERLASSDGLASIINDLIKPKTI